MWINQRNKLIIISKLQRFGSEPAFFGSLGSVYDPFSVLWVRCGPRLQRIWSRGPCLVDVGHADIKLASSLKDFCSDGQNCCKPLLIAAACTFMSAGGLKVSSKVWTWQNPVPSELWRSFMVLCRHLVADNENCSWTDEDAKRLRKVMKELFGLHFMSQTFY